MSRILQLIWNPATQRYCPAPQAAPPKRTGCGRRLALALAVATASSGAYAGPTGGAVVDGNANIDIRGKLTEILQNTQNTTIVWDSFDINADEIVNFIQPNDSSIALNRVFSADGTHINGQLNANGRVFVVDANGVLFGQDASVNVGSLVASTLDVTHTDYTNFSFSGNGNPAAVTNLGNISVADSGAVALLGGQVANRGVIQAKLGNVALAAGNKITLDFAGDNLLNVQVDEAALNALAENHGLIQANGGQVLMTAHASDALLQTVVNNTGVIEAQTLQQQDGKIMLLGGMSEATGGTVKVGGTLDTSAPNGGDGGFIETSGAIVKVASGATLDTSSADGTAGTWLLDPTDLEISYDPMGANDDVSHVHTQALQNSLAGGNVTLQTANAGGGNGDITIVDPIVSISGYTLSLDADGDIIFNDYIQVPNGGLNLTAVGDITTGAEGHINVDTFTLEAGNFSQVMATLPIFSADDFVLNGGTFTRATGGNGTGSPLQITDIYGLQGLATTLDFSATLQNDIDASGATGWNNGEGFAPIGVSDTEAYNGAFDGAGFTVDGLSINRPSQMAVGLFAYTSASAFVTNIGLTNSDITGLNVTAPLVAYNEGTISQSYATGTVTAGNFAGGLVGWNLGDIVNSYTTAAVTGPNYIGGLVGLNSGDIDKVYATGEVTGTDTGVLYIGGLVGSNSGNVTASYWDSFTTGLVGGVGSSSGTFTVTAVNGDWGNSPDAYNAGSYSDFDFTSSGDWFIAEGSSRPMLRAFLDGGNISNLYQLQGMAANLGGTYTLTQDIDASATQYSVDSGNAADVWGGRGFAPVGWYREWNDNGVFTGNLDGANFVIDGLTINRPDQEYVGLFGRVSGASGVSLQNLGLTNVAITGDSQVGSVMGNGFSDGGSILVSNVFVDGGTVTGNGDSIGGLIGSITTGGGGSSEFEQSYARVSVTSTGDEVGGLVGSAYANITTSFSEGSAQGSALVGGLVGRLGSDRISNSYSTASVDGANSGGLVGYVDNGTIEHSWASGAVVGANSGGLVGQNDGGNVGNTNYWDGSTTGMDATGFGGGSGTFEATEVNGDWSELLANDSAYSADNYTGFDFDDVWFIAEGSSRPMLRTFLSGGGEIHNLYDLQGMTADLGGSYTLMADIDALATASTNNADIWGGRGFAPVGNATTAFTGSLNGNGFLIDGLKIDRPDQDYVGLFGHVGAAGQLSNIRMTADVIGADQTGLLAGANAGSINNAFIGGEVIGTNAVGGVAGLNSGAIDASFFFGFFSGQVQGDTKVGGLVGENIGNIDNSHTLGTIVGLNAASQIGGLVGFNNGGTIAQSYTLGDATGTSEVGALVGENTGTLTNLFWETSAASPGIGAGDTSGATGLTSTAEVLDVTSFASWGSDIDAEGGTGSVWRIYDGDMFPLLRQSLTEIEVTAYDDYKVYDGAAYDGLHDINATTGAGVRYGNNYAEFVAAFGEDDVPYDGGDSLNSGRLEYSGDSQGAINAGTYDITPSALWSGLSGYDIVMTNGVLTIDQQTVSVTVNIDDASKVYGNADPTFSWGVTSGSLGSGDSLTGSLSRAPGENVGSYAITGNLTGDLASSNYNVTLVDGVFTITPRPITVNIADLDKVYGNADPTFSWSITGGSLAAGDELNGTLTRAAGEDVGGYAITGALTGDVASSNYTVTVDDGLLTITPRPLVISADDLAKVYGQDDPELTWSQGGSVVDGDTLTVSLSRTEGQDVGYYTITPEVGGDVLSDNYALSINNGALQITPAALTVTANDIETYWNLLPPFTATLDGLTNGDTEQDVFGNSLVVSSDLTLPLPGEYTLTPTATLASNNYTVSFNNGVLNLLSSQPGGGYNDGLTSTQLPAREALGRQDRANIYEGRDLLTGELDDISLGVYQDGVRLPAEVLAELGLPMPRAVLFAINSDKVEAQYREMLQEFVTKLAQYPELNLLVEGHTSHTGPRLLNEKLARKRAMAVYNILVELGVEPARLGTKGFSWNRPVADNSTLEGRALNRRTEITPDKPSAAQDSNADQ